MQRYFFHLIGETHAHDDVGHECADDSEACRHGSFVAHRIGNEKVAMVKDGNQVVVENDRGDEVCRIPLSSSSTLPDIEVDDPRSGD